MLVVEISSVPRMYVTKRRVSTTFFTGLGGCREGEGDVGVEIIYFDGFRKYL